MMVVHYCKYENVDSIFQRNEWVYRAFQKSMKNVGLVSESSNPSLSFVEVGSVWVINAMSSRNFGVELPLELFHGSFTFLLTFR